MASFLRASISPTPAYRSNSRSPSRSPARNASYQSVDPLLSNLSPESTIEALTSTQQVPAKEKDSYAILSRSISQVSQAERALGIRAAVAAQRLGLWYKEVQTWEWPAGADAQIGKGFIPPSPNTATDSSSPVVAEHYGSLPAHLVRQYEKRIEDIRDGMESLNVEELKDHVLSAHIPSRSRPSSSNSSVSTPPPLSYVQLSDFTAVITATILRALPLLSRLNSLLSTWDARLLVLRQVPGLLSRLRHTRVELDTSLNSLNSPNPPGEGDAVYSNSNFHSRKADLQAMVTSVGRRMDNILDRLEGREDSLPENWIDDVEAIESDFGAWVKDAQRRAVENESTRLRRQPGKPQSSPNVTDPVTQNASSAPMQTIDEESGIFTAPATIPYDKESSPIEQSGVTSESHVITSSNRSPEPPLPVSAPPPSRNGGGGPGEPAPAGDAKNASPPLQKLLESPIKLSKTRRKHFSPEPLRRRASNASADSSPSDYPSLVSSPDIRHARAASSNGTPLFLKTPPQFQRDSRPSDHTPTHGGHTVREEGLLRLNHHRNSPRATIMHNRAVSLPLQRFINEGLENHDGKGVLDKGYGRRGSIGSAIDSSKEQQDTSPSTSKDASNALGRAKHPQSQQQRISRGNRQIRDLASTAKGAKASGRNVDPYLKNSGHNAVRSARSAGAEGTKDRKSNAHLVEEDNAADSASEKTEARLFTKLARKPKDRLDEKISSILSTLPAPIHLISAADDQDRDLSGASTGGKSGTTSSQGEPSDSLNNGTPSITLTAAPSRRRHSQSRPPEESSVKVYHLHRGGKSVPTKLFVRTVWGSEGRVMVRVGGGWADLGEYLREYAVHHGSRSVSESPRVEVQGISPHDSPAAPAHRSIISPRPASSVAARKKRRGSSVSTMGGNAPDMAGYRAASTGEVLSTSFPAPSDASAHRFSISSNASIGGMSPASDANRLFTPSTSVPSLSSTTPLGLAGPKPRSRQVSMGPVGDAWVEDVLGQARRSSLNPHKIGMIAGRPAPKLSKARSIGDMSMVENRRVTLRGLSDRR